VFTILVVSSVTKHPYNRALQINASMWTFIPSTHILHVHLLLQPPGNVFIAHDSLSLLLALRFLSETARAARLQASQVPHCFCCTLHAFSGSLRFPFFQRHRPRIVRIMLLTKPSAPATTTTTAPIPSRFFLMCCKLLLQFLTRGGRG
jgi:hypothetical protein